MKWRITKSPFWKKDIHNLTHLQRLEVLDIIEKLVKMDAPWRHRQVEPILQTEGQWHRFKSGDYRLIVWFDRPNQAIVVIAFVERQADTYDQAGGMWREWQKRRR